LLEVETISQDCALAEGVFANLTQPRTIDGHAVPRLTFGDPRVMALMATLCLFLIPPHFRQGWLRAKMAELLGIPAADYSPHQATYDLRRLRQHGLIERLANSHRYQVTPQGRRVAMLFVKRHNRLLRPGLSQLFDGCPKAPNRPLANAFKQLDRALEDFIQGAKITSAKNLIGA
jgi:DNA-binding PadR family transcriptional regulator